MAANIIIHTDERRELADRQLKDYGIDPERATKHQRDMADCVSCKTKEAYATDRRF